MKTLKSMLGVALLFIVVAANATVKPVGKKLSREDVVKTYIDAIVNGKTSGMDDILDDDLQFNLKRGDNVNTLNKDQVIDYLKDSPAAAAEVTTTTAVEQEDDNASVIKVTFKYPDYTRTDELTLSHANGWTITNIQSSSK